MDRLEFKSELCMQYRELILYLQNKYGLPKGDYFTLPNWSKSKKISRTPEGLLIHHVDEDKGYCLSKKEYARDYPFAFQKADHLVYCNYLEHLLLHIKIEVIRQEEPLLRRMDLSSIFNTEGFNSLIRTINTLYSNNGAKRSWEQNCYSVIKDNFDEYILLLNLCIYYLDKEYKGTRDSDFQNPNRSYKNSLEKCKRRFAVINDGSSFPSKSISSWILGQIQAEETPVIKAAYHVLKKDYSVADILD